MKSVTALAITLVLVLFLTRDVYSQAPNITYTAGNSLAAGVAVTISPVNTGGAVPATTYGQVTIFAGSPAEASGFTDGAGSSALFNWPQSMVKDASGNLYVTDYNNNAIRMITPLGVVSTFAGSTSGTPGFTNGVGTSALFNNPDGIAIDGSGNLYVADYLNNAIRMITPGGGVTTFYSTTDTFGPGGISFDGSGNLIVTAQDASQIISITPAGIASIIAGSTAGYANGTSALFNAASDVKADGSGNLYVADFLNNAVRKITPTGVVTTFAGSDAAGNAAGYADGVGTAAVFNNAIGLAIGAGGVIYVSDTYNNDIRRIMPDGTVSLVAGNAGQAPGDADGTGTAAGFYLPVYLYVDNAGTGYISEVGGNRIRKIVLTGYVLSGTLPAGLTFNPTTGVISGTPAGTFPTQTNTITAYNSSGYSSATITFNSGAPSNPSADADKNWIYVRTYDEAGNEIGATKQFFDNNGKATQLQSRNETAGQVLASQTLYDVQQRGVLSTLPAPTNNSAFAYSNNFMTSGSVPYSYLNFDGDPSNAANPYQKVNSGDVPDNTTQGTLGWYYSNNNTTELFTPATTYPYSRIEYYHDGTGAPKRTAGVGEHLNMGGGHETGSNSFPVQHELDNYLAIRNQFFPSAVAGNSPVSMAGQALQSVSTDQNGTSVLSVTDLTGKNTLMTARADASGWLAVQNTRNLSNVKGQYSFSVHIDGPASVQGNLNDPQVQALLRAMILSFGVNSLYPIVVTCTSGGIATWTGTGNTYVPPRPPLSGSYSFTITSAYPFTISATNSYGSIYDQAEAPYTEPTGTSIQYFQLAIPSQVTLTGSYMLYNMLTETDVTSTFTNGNFLPAGYYKVIALAPADNSTNNVTLTYINKYSDISYNYYNQLGQLIASIAPNGVQQLILNQNNLSQYTLATLPFLTTYQYDLQGRLISSTSPDGGTANYIYRQDGKIRFSQNAYQAKPVNSGTGNEKFSYTNYDTFGRPVESGEYVTASGTFGTLGANTAKLEATDPTGGLSGGTKLSQVNTYYDVPAVNLNLMGFVQDAGFLKGAVSYTSNANSTTWYNYDDHGRVSWMVKQLAGLPGYKTVNYTYNDQGNVTVVDYQAGTPAERFIHYYRYDADGRLVNVQTGTDGITKLQQASYYYYLHGPLKRTELGDQLQGMDYVYTPQGWLKSLNTPTGIAANDPHQDGVGNSFAKDVFGMQLEYFQNDYNRIGSNITSVPPGTKSYYNGNVNGMSWQSYKPLTVISGDQTGTIQAPAMYAYTYDDKYQYTSSTWGRPSFTQGSSAFTGSNLYGESGINYDPNGNIMSLQRTNNGTNPPDNFGQYSYTPGTNMLTGVGTTDAPANYASYNYDEIGRLKQEIQTGSNAPSYNLQYDVTGKVTAIYQDPTFTQLQESFTYDETGNRIKTVDAVNNKTTYYVYDASGNVLAIYSSTGTTTPVMSEVPVYGKERLGSYTVSSGGYVYELRDNVGSVRVVVNRSRLNGKIDIIQYNDYYPYGGILGQGGPGYHYEYQGLYAEKDQTGTGLNNFKLRMYDSRIGRWLTTDPEGQFASPYEGMGNNPVSGSDPTGGDVKDWVKLSFDGTFTYDASVHSTADAQALYGAGSVDVSGSISQSPYDGVSIAFGYTKNDIHIVPYMNNGSAAPTGQTFNNNEFAASIGAEGMKQFGEAGQILAGFIVPGAGAAVSVAEAAIEGGAVSAIEASPAVVDNLFERVSGIVANKIAGDAFRNEIASLLQKEGREVSMEAYKWTSFGKRFIDIEVSQGGKVLGGIETKLGGSKYTSLQRIKDIYLEVHTGYKVQLVRGP